MVFTLCIERPRLGVYEVVVSLSGDTVWTFTGRDLSAVLKKYASHSIENVRYFLVWYEHVCAGTVDASEIRADPELFARRVHSLHG